MSLFQSITRASSGMTAERLRMDVIADNLANASTTRNGQGEPFQRKVVTLEPRDPSPGLLSRVSMPGESDASVGKGVRVTGVVEAEGDPRRVYKPEHPDANEQGYVLMPNVEPTREMVDMIGASRAYEANVTTIETAKRMFNQALTIAR